MPPAEREGAWRKAASNGHKRSQRAETTASSALRLDCSLLSSSSASFSFSPFLAYSLPFISLPIHRTIGHGECRDARIVAAADGSRARRLARRRTAPAVLNAVAIKEEKK